ncbi:DUF5658 family protein [Halorhabdus salina]|uniref:DUF5658 family protein n=1 Tax=Halorhabdus salina TaxID=2750670 RepID=UPI00215D6970|nr:DUF5658 family protein [Halorhabdus salina]
MVSSVRHRIPIRLERPGYVELVFSIVIIWGFADVVSTLLAAATLGSVAAEANPWIRVLLATEPLAVIALKGAVVLYVGVVLLVCRDLIEQVPGWRIWFLGVIAVGTAVVCQNLSVVAATI